MGKNNNFNSVPTPKPQKPVHLIHTYRKQIGKQENKITKKHNKAIEKIKVENTQSNHFRSYLGTLLIILFGIFIAYIAAQLYFKK